MLTTVIDAELDAATKAGDEERVKRLRAARAIVAEFRRLAELDPTVAGMMLDALPVRPAAGSASRS